MWLRVPPGKSYFNKEDLKEKWIDIQGAITAAMRMLVPRQPELSTFIGKVATSIGRKAALLGVRVEDNVIAPKAAKKKLGVPSNKVVPEARDAGAFGDRPVTPPATMKEKTETATRHGKRRGSRTKGRSPSPVRDDVVPSAAPVEDELDKILMLIFCEIPIVREYFKHKQDFIGVEESE